MRLCHYAIIFMITLHIPCTIGCQGRKSNDYNVKSSLPIDENHKLTITDLFPGQVRNIDNSVKNDTNNLSPIKNRDTTTFEIK